MREKASNYKPLDHFYRNLPHKHSMWNFFSTSQDHAVLLHSWFLYPKLHFRGIKTKDAQRCQSIIKLKTLCRSGILSKKSGRKKPKCASPKNSRFGSSCTFLPFWINTCMKTGLPFRAHCVREMVMISPKPLQPLSFLNPQWHPQNILVKPFTAVHIYKYLTESVLVFHNSLQENCPLFCLTLL